MTITKVFQSGNSRAVRIPREFQFDVAEVEIERHGDEIVLRPPARNLSAAFAALTELPDGTRYSRLFSSCRWRSARWCAR
jgi:antitoxin VapB